MPAARPVLVAPDSFKGTLTAAQVAGALAAGLQEAGWPVDRCPVADGGEGTTAVLADALGAETRSATVSDPLGRPVQARFAVVPARRLAVLDTAQASGLHLVAEA